MNDETKAGDLAGLKDEHTHSLSQTHTHTQVLHYKAKLLLTRKKTIEKILLKSEKGKT